MSEQSRLFRSEAITKLRSPDQLDELMTVISPKGWLALIGLCTLLAAVLVWACVATVQTKVSGSGILTLSGASSDTLEAVMYVSAADGQRIEPGMAVQLSPVSANSELYGFLVGQVAAVRSNPATQREMLDVLKNDALAQSFIADGALIEVHIQLHKAPTASGYQWTRSAGPPKPLADTTLALGQIVVAEQRPIALLFPALQF
jgi:hypothetical protein